MTRVKKIKAVGLLLIALLVGMLFVGPVTQAARAKNVKDLLSDSRPSTVSNHTIQFITPSGVSTSTDTMTLTFDSSGQAFDLDNVALDILSFDLSINDGTADCGGSFTDKTIASSTAAGTWGVSVATSTDIVTFTPPTDATAGEITADYCVKVEIGTHAANDGTGVQQITNPSSEGVVDIDIAGDFGDTGKAKVSIISGVTVSATVAETLTFTIYAQTDTECDSSGGLGAVYDASSTTSTIPFGTIDNETFYDICQKLFVRTNAKDGYSTTVKETDQLTGAATSDEIGDGTCDGACDDTTSATWATATNNGFGYCMVDSTGNAAETSGWTAGAQCSDGTPEFKTFPDDNASEAPEDLMSSANPAGNDTSYISYRLSVDVEQSADDYSNTIIYVTTPQYN
ncbi:MAG: hypothetical protein U9P90_00610 [Patescibacteria group bacterium]|nr:hypothetical protein [Patescibacteria group bacterium]